MRMFCRNPYLLLNLSCIFLEILKCSLAKIDRLSLDELRERIFIFPGRPTTAAISDTPQYSTRRDEVMSLK